MAHVESIQLRQHHIQNDQVVRRRECQRQAFLAVVGDVDRVALLFEAPLEDPGEFVFVFDNEDTHRLKLRPEDTMPIEHEK